jgi:hypothetical protein
MIKIKIAHFCDHWIEKWCQENGWTDLFIERCNNYWAFPPGAVMPEPIPTKILRIIKQENGLSPDEKNWLLLAFIVTVVSLILSCCLVNPMPIVFAFAFNAIAMAKLEMEDI